MEWTIQGLANAYQKCAKASYWKRTTQMFGMNLLAECVKLKDDLESKTWRPGKVSTFVISERGKTRDVVSVPIRDRVVQRCFCDECLIPRLTPYLCYDNSATRTGRGVDFARNRFARNIQRAYDKWGGGYVLQTDFKSYFASIPHDQVIFRLSKHLDSDEMWFVSTIVNENPGSRGLGLGSQVSQTLGVWYPTPFDNYVRCVRGYGLYGRYMDDANVIARSKEELWDLLEGLREQCCDLGLTLNEKKTNVVPLTRGATFLKVRYRLVGSRVEQVVCPDTFRRERRRIKAYKRIGLPRDRVVMAYKSWRGSAMRNPTSLARIMRTDEIFVQEFGDWR